MKAFYALFLLVFLASCGSDVAETVVTPSESTVEETSAEIDSEIMEIPEDVMMEDTAMNEVEVLDAAYTNPKGPVDMEIEYALNENGVIESIDVSATTYDLSGFNDAVQSVVGMTLEEASDTYVSGSSLTSAAFNDALKSAM